MSIENEEQAESALLSAVMGVESPGQALGANEPDEQDIDRFEAQGEDAAPEAEQKAAPEPEAPPEEDIVEIPGEDGAEPVKLKVAELVESHKAYERIKGQEAQIIERVEREATEQATQRLQAVEHYSKQTASMIQAALQLLQPPQPPNAEAMLNPASPQYDPDGYHRAYAKYQLAHGQFQQAQGISQQLMQQAQAAQAAAQAERETQELRKLQRVWPEFGQPEATEKFVSDMTKAYGFTAEELDAVLTDHRQAIVARDALAYRAMKAQSGDVKAKVEAKAPKLVRSKQEPKGSVAQQRDTKGQFVAGTYERAVKSRSDDDWAHHFAALSKAGRI